MNRIVGFFAFIGMSLVAIPACESSGLAEDSPIPNQGEFALMPTEVWTNDADQWLDSYIAKRAEFTISRTFDDSKVIEMYFDEDRSVYRASIVEDDLRKTHYFFDNKRLIYSLISVNNESSYLAAYANNEPFAAARGSSFAWEAMNPAHSALSLTERKRVLELVREIENREKILHPSRRIQSFSFKIEGTVMDSLGSTFYLNARKGNMVKIKINSSSPDVFFTTNADNASEMEQRSWSGRVNRTGDIIINILSLDRTQNPKFELTTELIDGQNPA
jgi:hypothetical protein